MEHVIQLASAITARYGVIKRARGCFLYTAKGVRLTDLYQEGGRAILGWGGSSAYTVLKNVLSRGITGSYDTDFTPRADGSPKSQLSRAASALLKSERTAYLFTSREGALRAALQAFPESTSCYRPWSAGVDWSAAGSVIVEPPLAWCPSVWLVAVKAGASGAATDASDADSGAAVDASNSNAFAAGTRRAGGDAGAADTCDADGSGGALTADAAASALGAPAAEARDGDDSGTGTSACVALRGERIAAPLCAAITRSLYDLLRALPERQEKDWFIYDTVLTKYWTRQGPYLFPKISEARYAAFVLHCLDRGIVISPRYNQPSIVPFGADRGVFRALQKEPFDA